MSIYEIGTMAVATIKGERVRVFRSGRGWQGPEHWHSDSSVIDVRPLVVIDPEDFEQAERLARAFVAGWGGCDGGMAGAMHTALNTLIAPSKPAEPTGLGAVVEDAEGKRWVRGPEGVHPWVTDLQHSALWFGYDEVDAVRVLSEGVA